MVEDGGSTFLFNSADLPNNTISLSEGTILPRHSISTSNLTVIFVVFQMTDHTWLKEFNLKIPIPRLPRLTGVFRFEKPTSVSVIGSFGAGCCLGPDIKVDLKVEMPQVMTMS
jgi:hypothetical protein